MRIRHAAATAAASTLIAASLIAAPGPATAAPAPVAPQPLPAITGALEVFQGLATSTATQSAQGASLAGMPDIFGWEMAAIGIAGSAESAQATGEQLQTIDEQISAITDTISTIDSQIQALQAQLAALSEQVAYSDCQVQTAAMNAPLASITSQQTAYQELAKQASAAAAGTGAAPEWSATVQWAQTAVKGESSIPVILNFINNVLVGTTDDGSIAACAKALAPFAGSAPFAWEQAYYSQVYNYVTYWYQVQVVALNLYVQAMHVLALQASTDPAQYSVGNPAAACQPPVPNGDMVTACNLAADAVSSLIANITSQFAAAGAPYSWGTGGQVYAANPAGGQAYAWLMDLNDFQTSGCALPLSSAGEPCGGTVGTSGQFANPTWGDFTWGTYTGWVPAKTVAWQSIGIQSAQNNQPVWQALQQIGMGDPTWGAQGGLNDLIVYTGEVAKSFESDMQTMGDTWVTGQCFLDTATNLSSGQPVFSDYQNPPITTWNVPACDSVENAGALLSFLMNYAGSATWSQWPNGSTPSSAGGNDFWRSSPIVYSNPAFYNAAFYWPLSGEPWTAQTAPGWVTAAPGATFTPTPQFRWPALPLTTAMCSVKSPAGPAMTTTNPAGAYTMCGADMAAWMAAQLPTMPTPVAPIAVSAVPTLRAAVVSWRPGSVRQKPVSYRIRGQRAGGKWRTLVRDTSAKAGVLSAPRHRLKYPVPVARSGLWRFTVVALMKDRKSRPSAASRPEYITTKRIPARYYVFTRGDQRRSAKAFKDGRVYWAGRPQSGFGVERKGLIRGHTFRNPYRWSGRWHQRADGTWKSMTWRGWQRAQGPARTSKGMPKTARDLPRY